MDDPARIPELLDAAVVLRLAGPDEVAERPQEAVEVTFMTLGEVLEGDG